MKKKSRAIKHQPKRLPIGPIAIAAILTVLVIGAIENARLENAPLPKPGDCVEMTLRLGGVTALLPRYVTNVNAYDGNLLVVPYNPQTCAITSSRGELISPARARRSLRKITCCPEVRDDE